MKMDNMLKELESMFDVFLKNDSYVDKVAESIKKVFNALLSKGFTREEATRLVASQGIGIKAN